MKTIINGLKINYLVLGEGRPILILHGWGSSSEKWQKAGELLSDNGFKIIIPDLPGFGQSQEPPLPWDLDEYCNFIEEFIKTRPELTQGFYLLGHSFGGALAVKYTLRHSEKIKKLFLVAPALIRRKTLKKKILFFVSKILKIFSFMPFYKLFRKAFYKFIVGKSDYPNYEGIMSKSYIKIIKEDLLDILKQVDIPTIIIWGEKDDVTPIKDGYSVSKKIAGSKLIIVESQNHDLNRKAPELLVKKILENI